MEAITSVREGAAAGSLHVGDRVVYPHHGVAIIEAVQRRQLFGETREYFIMHVDHGDLTLLVPVEQAEDVGLRLVIDRDEVADVLLVLGRKAVHVPTSWARRFKNHMDMLKSGDIYELAHVVRNLSVRHAEKRLSAAETSMLANARRMLGSELAFALAVTEENAHGRIDEALALSPSDAAAR